MMNVLALGLVLTSLVTAGFFTPSPEKQGDVIVKEGHRVVVVEYEKGDGNTKVSISPQDNSQASHERRFFDKLSEKVEDLGGKVGLNQEKEENHQTLSPGELVCDAYGKCKRIIASVVGKTTAAAKGAEEAVSGAKDKVIDMAKKASDKAREAEETVKGSAEEVSRNAKDKIAAKASEMGRMGGTPQEKILDKAKEGEKLVENVKKEGQKELSEILGHAGEVAVEVFDYVVAPQRVAPLAGVLHLMGFTAAYGMCVWVTFASSYVLAGSLPRHQFAMVQSKIYPVYFKAMAYSVGMALLGYMMSHGGRGLWPLSVGLFRGFELMAPLVMILVNWQCLEPRATKVMLERMKKEMEEGRGKEGQPTEPSGKVADSSAETVGRDPTGTAQQKPEEVAAKSQIIRLSETLQRLNSYSSMLNVLTLVSLTWHLVHLGQHLHAMC